MLEGATILVFADDWGLHPSSAQHLFARLLSRNRVIWCNTVGRLPRPTLADARKVIRKVATWTKLARPPAAAVRGDRPEVVDVPLLPLSLGAAARRINAALLRRAARARLGEGGFIVSTLPLTADLVGAVPGATFVYYLVDDYASWPGHGGPLVQRMDRQQASGADVIVAASRALADLHAGRARGPVRYLPHGVDVERFSPARALREERRARGERPLADALYFGAIDERLDQGLFAEVATRMPDTRFLILGPRRVALDDRLARAPNVEHREPVPYADLPAVLGACTVALLPYVGGALGAALSPLKAREALAAGLSVVATDVPELRTLGAGVRIGSSADEIVTATHEALRGAVVAPGLETLAADSWEGRAAALSGYLEEARAARCRP